MKRILYDVSKWDAIQHRDARGLPMPKADDAPGLAWADETFERLYAGEAEALPAEDRDAKLGAWAERFHAEADRLPAFERLSNACRGDVLSSALAAEELQAALAGAMQEALNPKPAERKPGQQAPGNGQGQGVGGGAAGAALRAAISSAVRKAEKEIEETKEAIEGASGIGGWLPGSEAGDHSGPGRDAAALRALAKGLKQNPKVRRIAALAGKFKRIAARKRREKVSHGADEVVDVETGDDLSRLLPGELAKLHHPLLRRAFLADYAEKRTMQYRLIGNEPKGRGPIVVLHDKSGSMEGMRDEWASAIALALLEVARREKRAFAHLPFDTRVIRTTICQPGDAIPEESLLYPACGGTEIANALYGALDVIEANQGALRKADVILITDGGSDASLAPALRERATALGVTIVGLGIGIERGVLTPWADDAHAIEQLDGIDDAAAEAIFAS